MASQKRNAVLWGAVILLVSVVSYRAVLLRGRTPKRPPTNARASFSPDPEAILKDYGRLPDFELTNQDKKPFGSKELRDRVWVADFVFLGCSDVCPRLTAKMRSLQERTKGIDPSVHLVTISVDPDNDTPERLKAYAKAFDADLARWTFLTGSAQAIERTVVNGFKIAVGKEPIPPPQGGDGGDGSDALDVKSGMFQIFHGERLVLVDGAGKIRGYFGTKDHEMDDLVAAVERLSAEGKPPTAKAIPKAIPKAIH